VKHVTDRDTYDRTFGIHLIAIHCTPAECGGLIKNKERKKGGRERERERRREGGRDGRK